MNLPQPPVRYQSSPKAPLSGGYGLIEIWYDTSLAREVAIKRTATEHSNQLLNELRALSQRPSPHIVEIYDVVLAEDGCLSAVILEYLTGQGFESIGLSSDAERPQALRLLYQMAQGLADLHAVNLVHRDVKPANAVCTSDGRLKLVDFGLSTPGTGAETIDAKGTIGYASPELFGDTPISISPAMDAYSFGMVCYKKLTGALPQVGPSSVVPDPTYYPLPSIATKITLPAALVQIIDQCLSWNPAERPSMQAVADTLMNEITFGKHAACLLIEGQPPHEITTKSGHVSSLKTNNGAITIGYDGYKFIIKSVSGNVYINNTVAKSNDALLPGCLLTFGISHPRQFIPFRQRSPEIVF